MSADVAHRLSAVQICHRIVAVESGRIVEDGSPDDLLRREGRFATLHRAQYGMTA